MAVACLNARIVRSAPSAEEGRYGEGEGKEGTFAFDYCIRGADRENAGDVWAVMYTVRCFEAFVGSSKRQRVRVGF